MTLLIETNFQNVEVINEAESKELYIQGPFAQANVVNKNRRNYPLPIMEREIGSYVRNYVSTNRAVGELTHPSSPEINLDKISHIITEMKQQGNNFIGKAKVLNTPAGNIVRGLLEGGVGLGVSTRGVGSVKANSQGINEVQDDFRLLAVDVVWEPSAPDAFVEGLMEGAEFVWGSIQEDTDFVQQLRKDMDNSKKLKSQEAKIAVFEQFLTKIRG